MNSSWISKHEIGQLYDLRLNWNDKLEVVDGALRLTKGHSEAADGKLFIPDLYDVTQHLDFLITNKARAHMAHLKDQRDHYEDVADFKREVKGLNHLISNLRHLFKDKFETLYEHSAKLFTDIVEYKANLKKPLDRPLKHITYNERTELSSIKGTHSKRVSIDETVKAAETAFKIAEPKLNESLECCVEPLFCCLSTFSLLKIVIWNPIEWMCKGHVSTKTPLKWAIDDYIDRNKHMQAFQKYSTQILNCEIITNEVAMGFAKLAPFATTLDLKNATSAVESNTSNPQIDSNSLSLLLEAASASKLCNTIHISKCLLNWDYVSEFLSKHAFVVTNEYPNSFTYTRKPLF